MREIKFRAWDTKKNRFDYEPLICRGKCCFIDSFDNFEEYEESRMVLQQYTGLKDKNSKEIYESDYVKGEHRSHEDWSLIQKVTYFNGCYMFGNWNAQEYFNKHTKIEVIGNIYENPELLEVTP